MSNKLTPACVMESHRVAKPVINVIHVSDDCMYNVFLYSENPAPDKKRIAFLYLR